MRSFAASRVGPSTLVAERIIMPGTPQSSINSDGEIPTNVHSCPASRTLEDRIGNLFGYQYTSHKVTFR